MSSLTKLSGGDAKATANVRDDDKRERIVRRIALELRDGF